MGMTINEVIKEMEEEWKIFLEGTSLDNSEYREKELAVNDECKKVIEANESAIKYLKKYEKIEQIVNNYISSDKPYISVIDEDIRKVLEDENDN